MKLFSDDFGYDKQADKGIIRLIKKGKLLGASVLATMVSSVSLRQIKRVLEQKNNFVLGLHINLVEGKPVVSFIKIRSLLNSDGKFLPLVLFLAKLLLGKIDKTQIKSEIEGQLFKLQDKGLTVNMLDSHQHTHAMSPVAEIVVKIASEHKIRYIRSFDSVKTYSFKAKITYAVLKVLAFLSYFAAYKKIGMPATWKLKQKFDWTIMSWESDTFEIDSIEKSRSAFVIHPYLPYDTNRSYLPYIK